MNLHAGLVRREEMVELQRMLSEKANLTDALKKKNMELEDEVKELLEWQEELTQNAKEAEKDFNVKHRLWTEENSLLQSRNRSLAEERDRKDREASDAKDQLILSQKAVQQTEEQLHQLTMAYRELKSGHEGLPELYETSKKALKEASESNAAKDAVVQGLQRQLAAKQTELDALSVSAETRAVQLQKTLDSERQQHKQTMSDAHRRWEESLARVQGEKVMAEACTEQIKGEMQDLQGRFKLMQADVQQRDTRASEQIQMLEKEVACQIKTVAESQKAVKDSKDQLEQQRVIAAQAEVAMKAAQAEAAAAGEKVKVEKETGAQCTEEAIRAITAVDVQLQQAKEKYAELLRREKQLKAREELLQTELEQREQALEGQLKAAEDSTAARVHAAEQQVSAAQAALHEERLAAKKAHADALAQHKTELAGIRQHESKLAEQVVVLKQELASATAAISAAGKEDSPTDINGGTVANRSDSVVAMQDKEAELQQSVEELEKRYEKLQNEVKNAAAAREELTRLRKDVRDAFSQKGDLENLVRELQKEELSLRTKITGAKAADAPVGNSGSKHDSVPVAFGSARTASMPFGSPAMGVAAVVAGADDQNGTADGSAHPRVGLASSPCGDGVVRGNHKATPSGAGSAQNQGVIPPGKGGLFGGLMSAAAGMFGSTPALLADDTPGRIGSSGGGGAEAEVDAVELAPPCWQQTVTTPRIGDARTSTNVVAKGKQQQEMHTGAELSRATAKVRSVKISPEGTARLAARAKAVATAGPSADAPSTAPAASTKRVPRATAGSSALPKRPLSGSKRRRGADETTAAAPAKGDKELDAGTVAAEQGEGSSVADPESSRRCTHQLAAALAGNKVAAGSTKPSASAHKLAPAASGVAQKTNAQKTDAAVETARRRVAHKANKEAAAGNRQSQRRAAAAPTGAATPVGGSGAGDVGYPHLQVTPPNIKGDAQATRTTSAAQDRSRRKRACDDTKSGSTSASKSGLSGTGVQKAAGKGPDAKKRAVARAANATSAAVGAQAAEDAELRAPEPLRIDTSPEAEDRELPEVDDGDHPSTPHGMSARVQHLVEEAAAYTGYSPAELLNEDGQPVSARALRAASRAHSRSTMTPGKGVEEGEEVEGGVGNGATPQPIGGKGKSRARRVVPRSRGRSLQDIVETGAESNEDGGELE